MTEHSVDRLGILDFVLRVMRSHGRVFRQEGTWPNLLPCENGLMEETGTWDPRDRNLGRSCRCWTRVRAWVRGQRRETFRRLNGQTMGLKGFEPDRLGSGSGAGDGDTLNTWNSFSVL